MKKDQRSVPSKETPHGRSQKYCESPEAIGRTGRQKGDAFAGAKLPPAPKEMIQQQPPSKKIQLAIGIKMLFESAMSADGSNAYTGKEYLELAETLLKIKAEAGVKALGRKLVPLTLS